MKLISYPDKCSTGKRYNRIFETKTKEEAQAHLESLVQWHMRVSPITREEATRIELMNIGYWAGYGNGEDMDRILDLYDARSGRQGSLDHMISATQKAKSVKF